jgi:hypothetical protein
MWQRIKGDIAIMPTIITLLTVSAILGLIIGFLKTPKGKGWIGEMIVRCKLKKTKIGERYVINDLRLRVNNGKTCQIDHVLINKNGVFVIETKNYSGRIYGKENQLEWTQTFKSGRKRKFYNPIRQNKTHVYHISELIGYKYPIISVVVMVKGNIRYIDADGVCSLRGLKKITDSCEYYLTEQQMQNAYNILWNANDRTITNREHIRNISRTLDDVENGICPRCGNELVLRTGKNGSFYGCLDYPRCKFTKQV